MGLVSIVLAKGATNSGSRPNDVHVNGDAITTLNTTFFQCVGKLINTSIKFFETNRLGLIWIVAFPDDGRLVRLLLEVAIDAVIGHIQNTIFKPCDRTVFQRSAEGVD